MNLYKRPLFMQQGGMARVPVPTPPAAMRPAAAPQGAMPPMRPARAPMGPMGLPRAPAAAPAARPTDQAAGIASMVSDKAKADLAQAQGPEQIINAFRGNQKPLEARYEELAQYVGPQDATATPISVLTMVQPSLMMTAKGASESGIGELMAGIAGRVPMESAPGAPNRMGQGLGNIMMSRQAPQPAGMAQGGVVGKFAEGGSSLKDYYDEDLATFQEIMAPTQADRDASKRQLFFDIAQRGLAMAGGAGGSGNVASQLANVFQTLPGTYAAQQAELRKGEQGARNAALQSAAGRVGADREQEAKIAAKRAEMEEEYRLKGLEMNQKFIYDMTVEEAKARNNGLQFEGVIAVDFKGNPISDGGIFNMRDPKDVLRMRAFQGGRQDITFAKLPDLSDLVPSTDVDTFSNAAANAIFNRSDLRQALLTGQNPVSAEDLDTLNQAIVMNTKPQLRRVQNPETLQMEDISVPTKLSDPWDNAIIAAANRGLDVQVPDYLKPRLSGSLEPSPAVSTEPGTEEQAPGTEEQAPGLGPVSAEFTGEEQAIVDQIPDIDNSAFVDWNPADSFGTQAQVDAFVNSVVPKVVNALTGSEAGAGSPPEMRAESSINALNAFILQTLFSAASGSDDRLAQDERDIFRALIPETGTPAELAANQYERINDEFLNLIRQKEQELNEPQANFSTKQKIRQQIVELQSRSRQVSELSSAIRAGISGRPPISEMDLNTLQQQYIRGPVKRVP